jgi:hypothetical protein
MQETANINAEENTGVSGSSTDQEVDIDNLSEEELREELKREREAKQEAIRHMREQERKRKAKVEEPQPEPNKNDQDDDDVAVVARKIVQAELRKQTIDSVSKGSDNWLKEQGFAKDLFGESETSDRLYARVKAHAQKLADEEGVTTSEQYQNALRRAHVAITGRPDALLDTNSAEDYIISDKSQSGGYRGSTAPKQAPSFRGFSQADMVLVDRINSRRKARGEKPLTAGEILKK